MMSQGNMLCLRLVCEYYTAFTSLLRWFCCFLSNGGINYDRMILTVPVHLDLLSVPQVRSAILTTGQQSLSLSAHARALHPLMASDML